MVFIIMYRQIFCDFGDEFTVVDANDAEPASSLIANISKVRSLWIFKFAYNVGY